MCLQAYLQSLREPQKHIETLEIVKQTLIFSKIGPAATLFTGTRMRSIASVVHSIVLLRSILSLARMSADCACSLAWALKRWCARAQAWCDRSYCQNLLLFPNLLFKPDTSKKTSFSSKTYKTKKTQKESKIAQTNKTKKINKCKLRG